jgi:hypothetical protein
MNGMTQSSVLLTISLLVACSREITEHGPIASASTTPVDAVTTIPEPVKEHVEAHDAPRISEVNLDDKLYKLEQRIGSTK